MNEKDQLRLLLKALKGFADGVVSPDEAHELCILISMALTTLRPHAKSYIAKIVLDSASVVLRDIGESIKEKHGH